MSEMNPSEYHEINKKLDRIQRGLYGEDSNDQEGLIVRVKNLEELASKLNNAKWYLVGAFGIVAAIWGIIQGFIEIFRTIKGH